MPEAEEGADPSARPAGRESYNLEADNFHSQMERKARI